MSSSNLTYLKEGSPYLQLYTSYQNQVKKIIDGKLEIFTQIQEQSGDLNIFLAISKYSIKLTKNYIIIKAEFQNQIEYYIKNPQDQNKGFYVLIISNREKYQDNVVQSFKNMFFVYDQYSIKDRPELTESISVHCSKIFVEPLVNIEQTVIGYYLQKGGYHLGQGFTWVGKKASKGVDSVGNICEKKVSEGTSEVSETRKLKIQAGKQKTKSCCTKSKAMLEKCLTPVARIFQKLENRIDKCQQSSNPHVKSIYSIGKSLSNGCTHAYRGLCSGYKQFSGSVGKNTRNVTNKKYGKEFTDTYLGKQLFTEDQLRSTAEIQMQIQNNDLQLSENNMNTEDHVQQIDFNQNSTNMSGQEEQIINFHSEANSDRNGLNFNKKEGEMGSYEYPNY